MVVKEILEQKSTDLKEKNTLAIDYCVLNNDKTLEVIKLMEDSKMSALNPEKVLVIQDQIIPPNSPEVSSAQQTLMRFVEEENTGYHYGTGVASHILLNQYVKSGDVVVSGDPDILMIGAIGAMGICLGSAKLAQSVVYGKVTIPELEIFKVRLTGQLKSDTDVRAAAILLVKALSQKLTPAAVVEFYLSEETGLTQEECAILCGWMQKTGAMSAVVIPELCQEADHSLDLCEVSSAVYAGTDKGECLSEPYQPQDVRVVFIGGAYGGYLEDIKKTAEGLRGKKLAYKVRLVAAPATAEIYAEAADRGYLTDIMEAGGMIINQCGNPAVQARIGRDEVMVSNDIHNEIGYAGPESSGIYLTTTNQAIQCALTGIIGERGNNGREN